MSRKPPITVSSLDLERLESLIEETPDHVFPGKDALLEELGRATVLAPEQMLPDVVTVNTTVRFSVADSDREFRLTLVYLFLFAVFAASLLAYFAWNTRRMITEQIAETVNAEQIELTSQFQSGDIRDLASAIEARTLRPGANLYLVTTPQGQGVAGNVASLAPGVRDTPGWAETFYQRRPYSAFVHG